jgi:hypothetical protein
MSSNLGLKLLAGAIALAVGGTAMANTTLSTSTGDVFVNIVDPTNSTSFLFDTGVTQSAFNGGTSYSFNFAADPNYTAFLAAAGSNTLDYSVFSATTAGSTQTVFFTSSVPVPAQTGASATAIVSAIGTINGFFTGANFNTSSTTNSVGLAGSYEFGTALNEGAIAASLLNNSNNTGSGGYVTDAALGTALAFYDDAVSGRPASVTSYGVAFAGTWDVTGGVATYTGGVAAVPLPTPVLLLLSGLGLMGVVTRRHKTA